MVERFTRTPNEQIIHGRTYHHAHELRRAVATFVATYHAPWRLEKPGFLSALEAGQYFKPTPYLAT